MMAGVVGRLPPICVQVPLVAGRTVAAPADGSGGGYPPTEADGTLSVPSEGLGTTADST